MSELPRYVDLDLPGMPEASVRLSEWMRDVLEYLRAQPMTDYRQVKNVRNSGQIRLSSPRGKPVEVMLAEAVQVSNGESVACGPLTWSWQRGHIVITDMEYLSSTDRYDLTVRIVYPGGGR